MQVLYAALFKIFGWHITWFTNCNFFDCIELTGGLPDCVSFLTASGYASISFLFLNDKVCGLMLFLLFYCSIGGHLFSALSLCLCYDSASHQTY